MGGELPPAIRAGRAGRAAAALRDLRSCVLRPRPDDGERRDGCDSPAAGGTTSIWTSDVVISLWIGHAAIARWIWARCSSVSGPNSSTRTRMRYTPARSWLSSLSTCDSTRSSGMPWRLAYHIAVIALQVASAASKKSCGPGPESWPPVAAATSEVNEWLRTRTVLGYSPARRVWESIVFMMDLGVVQRGG